MDECKPLPRLRSKADWRSVVTAMRYSSATYVSRTCGDGSGGGDGGVSGGGSTRVDGRDIVGDERREGDGEGEARGHLRLREGGSGGGGWRCEWRWEFGSGSDGRRR